jgi:hypothetical protein
MKTSFRQPAPRRGTVLVYSIIMLTALTGFSSLGVDWGRVQLVKNQLRTAVDAAARAGASGLAIDPSTALARARATASANKADGVAVDLDAMLDVELGTWNSTSRHFTRLTGAAQSSANAIRVIARRTAARGNGIHMTFAHLLGHASHDVQVEATAVYEAGLNVNQNVLGTANPFLSGMPAGTAASLNNPHNSPDYAGTPLNPRQSPMAVPMPVTEGQAMNFDSISGDVRHDPNLAYYSPDGQLSDIGHNTAGAEHGISDMNCPINALVGVFLTDDQPDATLTPRSLDFSTGASRDFHDLRPQLKQLFFIGDGLDSNGNHQNFIAPAGATRLFLATWDFYEWNNNAGSRTVTISRPGRIVIVK